jgi:hypothetical protein
VYADRALPRTSYDELEIRAADGTSVRAHVVEPDGDVAASIVVVPVVRALATDLARRGYRAVTFAGRPAEHWSLVLECVRDRADGHPVIVLGPPSLVIAAKADALVFLGGRVWRGLKATLTSAVKLPVAQVLGRLELPLARLALGPTHIVRTEGSGERAYGAIAEAIEWAVRRVRTPE